MNHTNKLMLFLLVFILLNKNLSHAQTNLYSMTSDGGTNGSGTIFHIKSDGTGYNIDYDFPVTSINGAVPVYSTLCLASNGKLYGMTSFGGTHHKGIIFMMDPATETFTNLYAFGGVDGNSPAGNLIQASDGNLYGTTSFGGTGNNGVIFKFDPNSNVYSKLFDFTSSNGQFPYGGLFQANNLLLYGLCQSGGTTNDGTLYSFNISSNTFTKLINFSFASGRNPYGNLIQAANGKLYGMTQGGGLNGSGTIFSFDITTNTYLDRYDFNTSTSGRSPYGSLIQISGGLFYGMNSIGGTNTGGVIFSFDDATTVYTVIHNLTLSSSTDGGTPYGSLILASDGKLYGTTSAGLGSAGTLFSCTTSGTFTRLVSFNFSATGSTPKGSLIQAPNGKLYGLTSDGGNGNGTVFSYNIATSTISKLINFLDRPNGAFPSASLFKAVNGKLYGLTSLGGSNNDGVLFSYDPASSTFTKLNEFLIGNPSGNVIQASNGLLYGCTQGGGLSGQGTIFSYNISTNTLTTIVNFNSGAGGRIPQGSLIQASNGKLYGMTGYGGTPAGDNGVIFTYDIPTSTYTKIIDFDGSTNGKRPYGSLMQASNGKLYGMTYIGGANGSGVLFSLDPVTNSYSKIIDFTGASNGSNPFGTLIQGSNGLLYGLTELGGANNGGTIFSLNTATNAFTIVYSFPVFSSSGAPLGDSPQGTLMQGANGKLYGMTSEGGTNNEGVIFRYDLINNSYSMIKDLNFPDGIEPLYGNFIELGTSLLTDNSISNLCAGSAINVNYTVSNNLNAGNLFTAQLSNSSGSFSSPAFLGSLNSVNPGSISCIIPIGTTPGSGYRIRVISSNPPLNGDDNGINLTVTTPTTYYADADNDTYGNPASTLQSCTLPGGYVLNNTDCNDGNAAIHPGATEVCGNTVDDNCNGSVDEGCSTTLIVKLYIQGFYSGGGLMDNQGQGGNLYLIGNPGSSFVDVDTVSVSVMNSSSPFQLVEMKKGILKTNGSVSVIYSSLVHAGTSYYLKINLRNSLETWSKLPVLFSTTTSYDFTTSSSKAFDDGFNLPMKLVGTNPDRWAIFNGDVTGEGGVDSQDMTQEENNSNAGVYGYYPTDLNGDGGSDALDMTIIENNGNDGVFAIHP